MAITFSSLPSDIHITIIEHVSDFRTLVSLSRVNRALANLISQSVSQEQWRRLLAVGHIGRAGIARYAGLSWSDLAIRNVNHCAECRLCKMVLDDMRFQYFHPHADPSILCKALAPEEAATSEGIRMIAGIATRQYDRDRFQAGDTSPPLPLFSLWPRTQIGKTGEIKLSLSAALVLAAQENLAYNPYTTDLLDLHQSDPGVPGFPDLREERFRLDKHILLRNLFATTRPLLEAHVACQWIADHQGVVHSSGSMPIRNADGLTVHDILHAACQVGEPSSTEEFPVRNCIGLQLEQDNRTVHVYFFEH